jgi:hypothetical protein
MQRASGHTIRIARCAAADRCALSEVRAIIIDSVRRLVGTTAVENLQ